MLGPQLPYRPTEFDRRVFDIYVPTDHHLRKAAKLIDWDAFHDVLAPFYSENRGQPSEPPTMMLQLEYLRYHYNLSDRQVIERGQTDIAFRMFLQVDSYNTLPVECGSERWTRQLAAGDGYFASNQRQLVFGLGSQTRIDRMTVRWPSGVEQVFNSSVPVNSEITVIEERDVVTPMFSNR